VMNFNFEFKVLLLVRRQNLSRYTEGIEQKCSMPSKAITRHYTFAVR